MSTAVDGFSGRSTSRRLAFSLLLAVASCLLGALIAAPARAATVGTVTNYTGPGIAQPFAIAAGPDGALWFTNQSNNSIGRISTSGAVTNYTDPSISDSEGIAAGPDGALWFTNAGNSSIGRISTSGVVTNYTDPSISVPDGIAAGSDGALWFTNVGNGSIGRITTSGAVTNYTGPISDPFGITAGPDGALWFVNAGNVGGSNSIGRITTSGAVTSYTAPGIGGPFAIAAGSDGALWFTEAGDNSSSVGRITTSGVVTIYTDPSINDPAGIAAGPDGALWFTNYGGNSVGRITTSGVVTSYTGPGISEPAGIAAGPDGAMWFTNFGNNSIGRIQDVQVKASQAISFTSTPPAHPVFGGSYTVAATGGASGNPVVFSIDASSQPGACSIQGSTVSFTGVGLCVIDANQAGNSGYQAAPQVQQKLSISALALRSGSTACNGFYGGSGRRVVVPPGDRCTLVPGTQVSGNVRVRRGGALNDLGARIGHDLFANRPMGITISGGSVVHDVQIQGVTGVPPGGGDNYICNTSVGHDLIVEDGAANAGRFDIGDPPDCSAPNEVGHDLVVRNNAQPVDVSDNGSAANPIGHDLTVRNNQPGGATISDNYAGHDATCRQNSPQTGAGNHAAHNNGCPT